MGAGMSAYQPPKIIASHPSDELAAQAASCIKYGPVN
jgi:hypothetical protein